MLEQIKAKQLELEKMQKSQYKQEKELLRRKGEIMRIKHETSRRGGEVKNHGDAEEVEELSSSPTEQSNNSDRRDDDAVVDLNVINSGRSTSARRPLSATTTLSAVPLTPSTPGSDRKVDQFVRNMEERARMREQLKREREEKKKKQEQEKLELMKGLFFFLDPKFL